MAGPEPFASLMPNETGPALALAALPAIQSAAGDKDQYIARAAKYLALNLTGQYDPAIPLSTGEAKAG